MYAGIVPVNTGAMIVDVSPTTPRKPRQDAVLNRERVLIAATQLVRCDGEKVPIAKIAQQAGVGVGTVYRHFPDRQHLLGALVHRSFLMAVENAKAAEALPGSALEGVRAFFLATLRDREQFVLPLHGGPSVFTPATRKLQAEVREALSLLIERGQTHRDLRPDLTPEDLIVAASRLSLPLPGVGDWDNLAGRQIELMVQGLGPTSSAPKR
jgi:AcrR family transcriptional regulator